MKTVFGLNLVVFYLFFIKYISLSVSILYELSIESVNPAFKKHLLMWGLLDGTSGGMERHLEGHLEFSVWFENIWKFSILLLCAFGIKKKR